jgi:hypothetical protein
MSSADFNQGNQAGLWPSNSDGVASSLCPSGPASSSSAWSRKWEASDALHGSSENLVLPVLHGGWLEGTSCDLLRPRTSARFEAFLNTINLKMERLNSPADAWL